MTRGRILYTGAFRFPDGDAAAARVLGIGKSLRALGYEVEYLGWEPHGRPADLRPDGCRLHQGFPYRSMGELREDALPALERLLRFLSIGRRTMAWLREADLTGVKAIIAYHGGALFLWQLRRFCRNRNIKLIFDCTEWYDPASLPGGLFGPVAIDSELRMRWVYPKLNRGIVISRYLRDHYASKGCALALVPPTVDLDDGKWHFKQPTFANGDPIRIVYAGTPGKKDVLRNAVLGLAILQDLGAPVFLDIVGPSHADLLQLLGPDAAVMPSIRDLIRFHGRVPQDQVPAKVAQAHFSLLMRPDKRYANAGFSTKLVESMAAGVPVLANPTSDIDRVVHNRVNGLLLRDCSTDAFVEGVLEAQALEFSAYMSMREAARSTARSVFDYRCYALPGAGLDFLIQG